MLTAMEAREITDNNNNRQKAKENVEKLSYYIKERALEGEDYLLFFLEHVELKDFMLQEFRDLGYIVERVGRLYYEGYPLYRINW